MAEKQASNPLLQIESLTVSVGRRDILKDVSLTVDRGETVGLVGGSGVGKSTLALAIMGLLPYRMTATGKIIFQDVVLTPTNHCRGQKIAIVFQDAATALNPAFTIGTQLSDIIAAQRGLNSREAKQPTVALLDEVGLFAGVVRLYPHQLSGGMRQRVLIAMALCGGPDLLIADEPTTALDARLQNQILALLKGYQVKSNCGLLLISHDLNAIVRITDRLAIMDAGRIVESGLTAVLLKQARNPYTRRLLASVLDLESAAVARSKRDKKQAVTHA